ncbi:MAG: hypothetical protein Q9227_008541 [Pyrenula ochraceoflavens]
MAVMSLIPERTGAGKYVSESVLSIGLGTNIGVLVQLTPQLIRGKDQAAAMGAITQFRALGGVVGFAIATNAFNGYVRSNLRSELSTSQLTQLLQSVTTFIESLPPGIQKQVRSVFASAYDLQMKIMIGFAVAQAVAVLLMWEKKFRRLTISDLHDDWMGSGRAATEQRLVSGTAALISSLYDINATAARCDNWTADENTCMQDA